MSDEFPEEPPILEPEPPPIVERRSYWGWIALCLVFFGLISLGLWSYFGRASAPFQLLRSFDGDLKQIYFSHETSGVLGAKKDADSLKSKLKELANEIEAESKEDQSLVSILVVVNSERGVHPTDEQLDILSKREARRSQLISAIYGAQRKLTLVQIDDINELLVGETFFDLLAKREANKRFGDAIPAPKLFDQSKIRLFPILMLGFGSALCLGPILWIVYFAFRNSGKWQPVGHPVPVQDANGGDAYAGRTACLLLSLIGAEVIATLLVKAFSLPDQISSVITFGLAIAAAAFFVSLPLNGRPSSLKIAGFRSSNPLQDILWGIGGAIAAAPIYAILFIPVFFLQKFLPEAEHPIQAEFTSSTGSLGLIMLIVAASVGAPIFEELVFRGNLLPALQSLFRKPTWAVVLCGALFAMIHPTGIPVWPILASMGMVAACLTLQRGSLLPAMTMHAVHNGAILMLGLVQI